MALSVAEELTHTTIRLECKLKNGSVVTGTGFFFMFNLEENRSIPLIVTNKHVVHGSVVGRFVLTKATETGDPAYGSVQRIELPDFEKLWIAHPDPEVDLAVFPLAPLNRAAKSAGISFFWRQFDETLIPDTAKLSTLAGIDDIHMIGYPNGLWDQHNNLPIVRKGITATNPKFDYDGKSQFLIDCACFPGSSGSPVLIYNNGAYSTASGGITVGKRLMLLGILYAGPQHVAEGEIVAVDRSLAKVPLARSLIPNNLGYVVKASRLLDFKSLLLPLVKI